MRTLPKYQRAVVKTPTLRPDYEVIAGLAALGLRPKGIRHQLIALGAKPLRSETISTILRREDVGERILVLQEKLRTSYTDRFLRELGEEATASVKTLAELRDSGELEGTRLSAAKSIAGLFVGATGLGRPEKQGRGAQDEGEGGLKLHLSEEAVKAMAAAMNLGAGIAMAPPINITPHPKEAVLNAEPEPAPIPEICPERAAVNDELALHAARRRLADLKAAWKKGARTAVTSDDLKAAVRDTEPGCEAEFAEV